MQWLIDTPFLRLRNDRALWAYIDSHNEALYRNERESYIESVSRSAIQWRNRQKCIPDFEDESIQVDLDEFEELI